MISGSRLVLALLAGFLTAVPACGQRPRAQGRAKAKASGAAVPARNAGQAVASARATALADHGLQSMRFTVDGVSREALIHAPATAKEKPTPLVFAFHGHGGTAGKAARMFGMHIQWPEAISVYMQGVPTPGLIVDPEGKRTGWQHTMGVQGDRDLKFFDAVMQRLKTEYRVDAQRVYCTGHSNGGVFTYVLWAARGSQFAAFAPSAAASADLAPRLVPKPALIVSGNNDPLVKTEWQRQMMEAVRKINGCSSEKTPWRGNCSLHASSKGTPLVTFIHEGGHQFPDPAPRLIAEFFKEQKPMR